MRDGPGKSAGGVLCLDWRFVADTVMGGVSTGEVTIGLHRGRNAARLTGTVSLDNQGGFIQMASNLAEEGHALDASGSAGLAFDVLGNGERYEVSLRTTALDRPWQSYRAAFTAVPDWRRLELPFAAFRSHRTEVPFDPSRLRRIGILAVGRAFAVDVSVADLGFYT